MNSTKILHTEWSSGWGGQEMRIISEALALQKYYNIEVQIATKKEAQIAKMAQINGLKVLFCDFSNIFDIKSIFKIARYAKKEGINIINTHSGKDTWIGWAAARLGGAKFIRTRHLGNIINPSRLNFVNSCADFIITTGKQIREDMIAFNRINPNKIKSVPTGIDESVFEPSKYDKNALRNELGFEQNAFYIGNIGLFREVKRLDIFLDIAEQIHTIHPQIRFVLAGHGDTRQKIEQSIKSKNMASFVKLMDFFQKPAEFFACIDVFLLTSSSEGVPQTLIQALFMQKPSIATNVGSIKDLYNNKNFLLKECNFDELFFATKELIENKELYTKLAQNKQEFVRENFGLKKMSAEIFSIYEKILKEKK